MGSPWLRKRRYSIAYRILIRILLSVRPSPAGAQQKGSSSTPTVASDAPKAICAIRQDVTDDGHAKWQATLSLTASDMTLDQDSHRKMQTSLDLAFSVFCRALATKEHVKDQTFKSTVTCVRALLGLMNRKHAVQFVSMAKEVLEALDDAKTFRSLVTKKKIPQAENVLNECVMKLAMPLRFASRGFDSSHIAAWIKLCCEDWCWVELQG